MSAPTVRRCKDCDAGSTRPGPHPGPRCHTPHHAEVKRRKKMAAERRILRRYGLSPERVAEILAEQGGGCAGCGKEPGRGRKPLQVDHDHLCCPGPTSCGKCVRGPLCGRCNRIAFHFREDPQTVRRLADYLERSAALRSGGAAA